MNTQYVVCTKGADPELFLVDDQGNFVSSIDKIGGTKEYPRPIDQEGNAVQEDNVAVEFNIPPSNTVEAFRSAIHKNLDYLKTFVANQGLSLSIVPSAEFSDKELSDPRAQVFGCDPDFNAWKGGEQNPRPSCDNPNLRSAGGHIHVQAPDGLDILEAVKAMDVFVTCALAPHDRDLRRRSLYGDKGAFRPKPYGFEYRTPSCAWIASDELIRLVWDQTDKAINFVLQGNTVAKEHEELITKCIKEGDLNAYEELNKLYQIV